MSGPCAKARVTATITTASGRVFRGTNDVRHPQPSCPRVGQEYARDDYRHCKETCGQPAHAEMAALYALLAAGETARGAVVRVSHHRCCWQCQETLERHGVASIQCEEVGV